MHYGLFILSFLLGVIITILCMSLIRHKKNRKLKQMPETAFWQKMYNVLIWVQGLWYPILVIIFAVYLWFHYPECKQFSFFDNFQGDNLIFLLLLLLLVLPFFSKFQISGVSVEFLSKNELSKYLAEKAKDTDHIASLEELEAEHNKGKDEE